MRIIEINGIKLEIDERTATTIEQYRVGDKLRVLVKGYGETYNIYPGVIIGFADFAALPSIEIMYMDGGSWSSDVFKFVCLNAKTENIEICPYNELECRLDKDSVIEKIDRAITKQKNDLEELQAKRQYFIERFAKAFEKPAETSAA